MKEQTLSELKYSAEFHCSDFSTHSRDDAVQAGKTMFKVLFGIFLVCFVYGLVVTIAMLSNKKTKSKGQLATLYAFADLTLLGKFIILQLTVI